MDLPSVLSLVPSKHELVDGVTYVSTAFTCWQLVEPKIKKFFLDFIPRVLGLLAAILSAAAEYLRRMKDL